MNAPIIFFAYNRPVHTRKTLARLSRCLDAESSLLYIYCDGPKADSKPHELENIRKVREIVKSKKWCLESIIIERPINHGLEKSISEGISEVINKHGKAIIVEDDVLCGKYFLRFCNMALDEFEHNDRVMQISCFMYPHQQPLPNCFQTRTPFIWGWATWKRAWDHYIADSNYHLDKLKASGTLMEFNNHGSSNYSNMLERHAAGKLNSWAINWYASMFNQRGLSINPSRSLTRNIGMDGSGANYDFKVNKRQYKHINHNITLKEMDEGRIYHPAVEQVIEQSLSDWNTPNITEKILGKISQLKKKYFHH